ncbi:DUF421 domain-containing protein [Desulfosporosinus sp. BICA1-9]|uniref:DUF421 domain-containing protein n=1 Tax=Desulfosporosinus sp. BICA1-9 TaxID=1531958 RepID=UPI00054B7D6D|nr:DUF421 domain-containing protein [Desulfosporosinus sp. BICA1-9]KJS46667.1 MAG: membrane protein [Peptococcaceae bacterium BRH_c23]KJS79588.1 MAG: membrane protein [Desulfosporosinus sp. BICA1-9]HBW36239.1 DUF421 domain-containing protein [Desulfosporosinus sp.]
MGLGQLTVELIVGFFSLLLITRVLGKTQITQLTAFDFISALILGELLGNAIYDDDTGVVKILFAVTIWGLLIFGIQLVGQKSITLRNFLEGKPALVIQKGVIDRQALKKNRMNLNELQNLLRIKDVFSVREVEYAILEPNGSLTVIRKPEFDTPTLKDLNIPLNRKSLPMLLVSDGIILNDNLLTISKNESWLKTKLKKQGFDNVNNIFFAEWREEDGLYVLEKDQ